MLINSRLIYRMLIVSILTIFAFGCSDDILVTPAFTPSLEQMDKSPFTGIPCAAPCWHGLEVGKSSESDVISVMPSLTFINQDSIQMFRTSMPGNDGIYGPGVKIVAGYVHPIEDCVESRIVNYSTRNCLELIIVDDILTKIVVGLNYEIKPDEAIRYLGNPDYVGYDNIGSEKVICEVYLAWSSSKLMLASTFIGTQGSDAVEKNCYIVRATGKIPYSFLISEARYLSNVKFDAHLGTSTGEFFEFTGILPEQ